MSTAKRLVLSLRGRKNSQGNGNSAVATATSSTRLVSAGTSPGHELDEIAVVSGTGSTSHHFSYGGCIGNNNDASSAAAAVARYSTGRHKPSVYHHTTITQQLPPRYKHFSPSDFPSTLSLYISLSLAYKHNLVIVLSTFCSHLSTQKHMESKTILNTHNWQTVLVNCPSPQPPKHHKFALGMGIGI